MRYGGAPKRDTLLQALHSMWVGRKRRLSGFVIFFRYNVLKFVKMGVGLNQGVDGGV